jgi:hypothetical protein
MLRVYISLKITTSSSALSASSSSNDALAEHRIGRFVSDDTATTVPFSPTPNATEEAIILAAKERMAAKLLAIEDTLSEPVAQRLEEI